MNVQKLLKNEGWESLTKLGIVRKAYPDRKLNVLNYNQIKSPKFDPVVMECRGLILDDEFEVVSRAFDRFFNLAEIKEISNLENCTVFEKADGTLVKIYYDKNGKKWEISTRGTAFAEGFFNSDKGTTFRTEIMKTCNLTENMLQTIFTDIDSTYIFEYISPQNRIVTPYEKSELVFLCKRLNVYPYTEDTNTTETVKYLNSKGLVVRDPKIYFQGQVDLELLKEKVKTMGLEEGFVIYDGTRRIKLKNPMYVQAHNCKKDLDKASILTIILSGEDDEYVGYYPEHTEKFNMVKKSFEKFKNEVKEAFEKLSSLNTQKEFAQEAQKYRFSSVLFQVRSKKVNVEQAIFNMGSEKIEKMLG